MWVDGKQQITMNDDPKYRRLGDDIIWLPCVSRYLSYRSIFNGSQQGVKRFYILRCSSCGLKRTFPLPQLSDTPNRGTYASAEYRDLILDVEQRRKYANSVLDEIEKWKYPPAAMLDIGCNIGILVKLAEDGGWTAMGTDIDRDAVTYGTEKFRVRLPATYHTRN
jgi:SAM-dependent methyltransferase